MRGGQDQFNWDDVKGDKHRENYLGKTTFRLSYVFKPKLQKYIVNYNMADDVPDGYLTVRLSNISQR